MTKSEAATVEAVCGAIAAGRVGALYLVSGDRVLAEPGATRIGGALAERAGCKLEVHKRPPELAPLLADLKTYSLFAPAKVVVAVETAVLADTKAAADLIDEALEACPVSVEVGAELSERERRSASRLLQTLRLFQLESDRGSPAEVIDGLPGWVLAGGKSAGQRRRRRGRRQVEEVRQGLIGLLEAARAVGLRGWADTELGELADLAQRGLPEGHALVLAESAVDPSHPLVQSLAEVGRHLEVGRVEAARGGGWQGIDLLARELQRETGVGIAEAAVQELARRTIQRRETRSTGPGTVDSESTARFAAEFRKLATLVGAGEIGVELVENVVEDRGEEDAWKTLDAIGAGRVDEALRRVRRLLAAAEDPVAARLSFFSLVAGFARQLAAVSQLIDAAGLPRRPMAYPGFKQAIAPRLQAELADGRRSPLAGLHPYRLYRAYTAACRIPAERLSDVAGRILDTELQLKGESDQPDVALTALVCDLAATGRR